MQADREFHAALLAAAEREQQRLAEDLHDSLCQNLVGISLLVKMLLRRVEGGQEITASDVSKINAYVDVAIEHSRAPLRMQVVSQSEDGLVKALEDLVRLGLKGISFRLKANPKIRIYDPQVARVLYRIAEDAARETGRRARAKEANISLTEEKEQVTLEIQSDGYFAEAAKHAQDDELLMRFAEAVGIQLKIERKDGCIYRAVVMNRKDGAKKGLERKNFGD